MLYREHQSDILIGKQILALVITDQINFTLFDHKRNERKQNFVHKYMK